MKDLRLVRLLDDGSVELTSELVNEPLSTFEAAIQRIMVALMNTPGTMIDASEWGAGAGRLLLQNNPKTVEEGRVRAAEVVRLASESILPNETGIDEYRITSLSLVDYSRRDRGFKAKIRIEFLEEEDAEIVI